MENIEYYRKGYLKGYTWGYIEFANERMHELLFRFYDPENGECNKLVSIDYGYENPMVAVYWDAIEAELTKEVSVAIEAHLEKEKIHITAELALNCLKYVSDKRVHSFTTGVCLGGADLEFQRVVEIINAAASVKMLFISEEFGVGLHHNIAAWDHLYQEWIFLECIPKKIYELH